MRFYETIHFILAGIFFWLVFSIVLVPCSVIFGTYKILVLIAAKCFQPDLFPISVNDVFFAIYADEEQPLMNVGTTLRLKGRVDTEQLMNRWRECFLSEEDSERYMNLYCYYTIYGGYVFKRRVKQINLKNHFVETTLPSGTDPEDYLSQWLVTSTFRNKPEITPGWQVLILRIRDSEHDKDEETIVSIKMHHGMWDGYSIVHMIDKLTGTPSPYIVNEKKKECLLTWLKHLLEATALTFDVFIRIIRTPDLFSQGNPFETGWVMSFSTLDDQLEVVKSIRKRTGAKFSNIVMSAMTGALKRMYIKEKGYSTEDLPKQLFFESPLALPKHPSMTKGGQFCNHFTAGIYASHLNTDDPFVRLKSLEKDFHSFQEHGGMRLMSWILFGYYWVHPCSMRRIYTNYLSYLWRFSVLYSGMMASPRKVSLVGHPVDNIYFLQGTCSAFPYCSLFLMCSTYAGKLDVSLYASKEIAKNKHELEKLIQVYLKEELHEMSVQLATQEALNKSFILDMDSDRGKGNFLNYWFCQTTM